MSNEEEEEEETEYDAAKETADDETTIEPVPQVQVSTTTTNLETPTTSNVTMGTSSGDTRNARTILVSQCSELGRNPEKQQTKTTTAWNSTSST